jgi:Fic family protein
VDTVQRLEAMSRDDRAKVQGLGRATGSALRLHHELLTHPITTAKVLAQKTGLTPMTVNKGLAHLCRLGVARELTGHKRNRVFSYPAYLAILNEGADLPGEPG